MKRPVNPFTEFPQTSIGCEPIPRYAERHSVELAIPQNTTSPAERRSFNSFRFILLAVFMGTGFLILASRVFALQVTSGNLFRTRAEDNRIRIETITAPRGLLFDRNGEQLVRNLPRFAVFIEPNEVPKDLQERQSLAEALGKMLKKDAKEFLDLMGNPPTDAEPLILADDLPYESALLFSVEQQSVPGIFLHISTTRQYVESDAFAHLLGYLGAISPEERQERPDASPLDMTGKAGAEKAFEAIMRGQHGSRYVEQNSTSEELRVVAQTPALPGENVVLTIDKGLQEALANALKESVQRTHATGGAAVAIDPRSGEVRSLVSFPSFDANALSAGLSGEAYQTMVNNPQHPFLNRAIMGEYPSGSTIKPVIAAAALQEQLITDRTIIQSTGGITVDKWFFPDWKSGGHGPTDVRKALAESVNTFFYTIGGGANGITGLGVQRITDYARRFGLGAPLGIDLPGESSGFLPSREWKERTKNERWYIGDTYHLSIGQGDLLVTPLQVAAYTAAIANGGTLYRPTLLHAITSPENKTQEEMQPTVLAEHIVDPVYLSIVRQGLQQAITSGSAQGLAQLPVPAAGKTGTAEAPSGPTHAWFTSFAPVSAPELVIAVIVEHGGEGHAAALPVARAGYEWYFRQHQE